MTQQRRASDPQPVAIHLVEPPRVGDLMFLRVARQRSLVVPPPGWELMARWPREQLWSRVALPREGTSVTITGLRGDAYVRVLREGAFVQHVFHLAPPGRLERLRQRIAARR